MTFATTKELYAMFLESDFWKALSFACRSAAKFKCTRCRKKAQCQAHHTFYRENWFDTLLSDLECVCRECHEKEHGIRKPKRPAPSVPVMPPPACKVDVDVLKRAFDAAPLKFREFVESGGEKHFPKQHHANPKRWRGGRKFKAFRPGMYEGLTPKQARAQVGKSYPRRRRR